MPAKKPTPKQRPAIPGGIQDALKILAEIRSGNAAALHNLKAADRLLGAITKHDTPKTNP